MHFFICCMLLLSFQSKVMAQNAVDLNEVEVVTEKYTIAQTGKKVESLDSAYLKLFKMNSLADAIAFNSSVFIKSYGLGASSSTSFRGGSASQTALLWNGVNIQNAMLGQADLSLLPSFLFNKVDLEYGGSSSLWGSGAVAGSIHLNNESEFNQGKQTTLVFGGGSYGLNNQAVSQLLSYKKVTSLTKMYHVNSVNNYDYNSNIDGVNKNQKLNHANYDFRGLMEDIKWQINPQQNINIKLWLNDNARKIPAFNFIQNKAIQNDKANRLCLDWSYVKNKYHAIVKACYLLDALDYTDSLSGIFSNSKIHTLVFEQQNQYVQGHHIFQLGANYTNNMANTNNYAGTKSMQKVALLFGDQINIWHNKIKMNIAARVEKFSTGAMPLTGNFSIDYKIVKSIIFSINTSKVYRQPSLNELYWWPGGNINLKPEEGYAEESNLKFLYKKNKIVFENNLSAFNRIINNWILWTPGINGNPSPYNIQKVWSRGIETTWKFSFTENKFKCGLQANSSYVLSTVLSNAQDNSNVKNKQLIYTPRYNFNGHLFITYQKFTLYYLHQYVGYRFFSSDNAQWLNPYQISSLKISASLNKKTNVFQLFFSCNNLFNNKYAIIANRPMPYRNYEFGLTIQTSKNK